MKRILLSSAGHPVLWVPAVMFASYFAWTCFTSGQASAQAPMAPTVQGTGGIALVDVNYIFKKHVRLHEQLKGLQGEAERVQKGFEQQLQDLQKESERLREFKVGSPEYTALEERLVTQKANIQGQIALKRKEFVQKEAHLYYNAYREISDEVYLHCQQHGIALVLNFNGDNFSGDNPDEVARGISNKVVFYTKNLDITGIIVRRFDGTQQPQGANAGYAPPVGVFAPAQR